MGVGVGVLDGVIVIVGELVMVGVRVAVDVVVAVEVFVGVVVRVGEVVIVGVRVVVQLGVGLVSTSWISFTALHDQSPAMTMIMSSPIRRNRTTLELDTEVMCSIST